MGYNYDRMKEYANLIAMSRNRSGNYSSTDAYMLERYEEAQEERRLQARANYQSWLKKEYEYWRNRHRREMNNREYEEWESDMYQEWCRKNPSY